MKYIILIVLIVIHLIPGLQLGYATGTPLYTHFTYSFQHTDWIHLALNSFAFLSFYGILNRVLPGWLLLAYAYATAVAASFPSTYPIPTVGASGIVYAMIGLYITISLIGRKLRITSRRQFFFFIVCLTLSIISSAWKTDINTKCHIYALLTGMIIGFYDNQYNK